MLVKCVLLCIAYVAPAPADATSPSDGLRWQTTLEAAQQMARQSNRLVLVHFGGPWCEPCRRLEKQVFSQPGFGRDLQPSYVAVKVDPREHPELAKRFGVKAVPTDVVITASGQLVGKLESPATSAAYSESLNRIAASVLPPAEVASVPRPATMPSTARSAQLTEGGAASAPPPATVTTTTPPAARSSAPPAAKGAVDRYADHYRAMRPAGAAPQAADQPSPPDQAPAPPAPPALALDGYCPVTLVDRRQWQAGDRQWGAIHRGRTYLFVGEAAQKAFLANPDRYSPVLSGNDPVMRLDHQQDVPGKREYGAFYNDRIYLFTSEDTFQRFDQNPNRYTIETSRQALRR
jgi:thiol-disulfide isomerase/thioredoxin/YHS domain-containing protein